MKLSYEWLHSFLPGLTQTPEQVAEALTMHSYETVVTGRRTLDPKITVVKITKLEPHPNADRLRLATVTDGTTTTTVVCGAPNIQEGDIAPFSPPGTQLYDETGQAFTLKKAKIRGVESPGMLNSMRELGLGGSHAGIFILPPDTSVGSKLHDHIPDDVILEADITRNRASDSQSHRGVARELSAILELPTHEFEYASLPSTKGEWQVKIEAADGVARYTGVVMKQVKVGASPLWLQARLLAMGARPINNVVDITNYVMFELGNPAHAFATPQLPGKTMGVRKAKRGETMATLDGTARLLGPDDLVVVSDDQPVALAGIMGGKVAEVGQATSDIFVEVANFNPYTIQQMTTRHGLRTEASARFSKGIDTELVTETAARLIQLLSEYGHGSATQSIDYYPAPEQPVSIPFRPERVARLSGITIQADTMKKALIALRSTVDDTTQPWQVTPPTDRLDLISEPDFVEEIVRLYGLGSIPGEEITEAITPSALPAAVAWREAIRDTLVRWGMTETYNYSFAPGVLAQKLGEDESHAIEISNPVAPELRLLRQSLVPGLIQNVQKNKSEFRIQQLFEIGAVFAKGSGGIIKGVRERTLLGGVVAGEERGTTKVEMMVDRLLADLGITDVSKEPSSDSALGKMTHLVHREKLVGRFGELSPKVLRTLKLTVPMAMFELDLSVLIPAATNDAPSYQAPTVVEARYQPHSKYPPVFRDISILVAPEVTIEAIQQIIERAGGDLVVDVDLFDVYDAADTEHDENLSKSVAFHIKYQSLEKTLTDDEVAAVHNQIVATVKDQLNAQIRE